MYDDKEIERVDKAITILASIREALAAGTKHYRKSDNKLLTTDKEIIQALIDEKVIIFEPKVKEKTKITTNKRSNPHWHHR